MNKKLTHEEFINKLKNLKKINLDEYEFLTKYKGSSEKIKMKHLLCGNIFEKDGKHILRGQVCPFCNLSKYSDTSFNEKVKALTGNEYTILSWYKNSKTKIKMQHNIESCKGFFEIRPDLFLSGQRCPCCSRKRAIESRKGMHYRKNNEENEIIYNKELISAKNDFLSYLISISENKPVKTNLKFFIKIPYNYFFVDAIIDHYAFKLFDGAEDFFTEKDILSKENYNLVFISLQQWKNKKEIIKKKIKEMLFNIALSTFIPSRKCKIKDISLEETKNFFKENSIEPYHSSNRRLALVFNSEIVSVITLSTARKKQGENKISNYISIEQYLSKYFIFGGFSAFINYLIKEYEGFRIIAKPTIYFLNRNDNVFLLNSFTEMSINKANNKVYYILSPEQ